MDGSEINNILFQALRRVTQMGEQGEAIKRALLLAIEAAAEMKRPDEKAAKEQVGSEARAAKGPLEEAAQLSETGRQCHGMLDRLTRHVKMLIRQGREDETTRWIEEIAKWCGQLEATAAALALLKLPRCPEATRHREQMQQNLQAVTGWMKENAAMMNDKSQETKRRDPAKGATPGSRPCRLKDKGCQGNHQLD